MVALLIKWLQRLFKRSIKFSKKAMGTTNVRLDEKLNKVVWRRGICSFPRIIRVQISRWCNYEEDAKEDFYSTIICFGPTLMIKDFFLCINTCLVLMAKKLFCVNTQLQPMSHPFPIQWLTQIIGNIIKLIIKLSIDHSYLIYNQWLRIFPSVNIFSFFSISVNNPYSVKTNGGAPAKECRVMSLKWNIAILVGTVTKREPRSCNFFNIFTTKLRR